MFSNYEIRRIGYDDIIYIYLDMKYEFSKEFDDNIITRRCYNYIKNNNIDFNGHKVFLVIDGIIIKSLDLRSI